MKGVNGLRTPSFLNSPTPQLQSFNYSDFRYSTKSLICCGVRLRFSAAL
jgi:hypothetical protein